MILSKTWTVNLYNDPHAPQRLTEERTLPPGTAIRSLGRTTSYRGKWSALAELSDGEWYWVYSWSIPAL